MLEKKPKNRLGTKFGLKAVKAHPWFKGIKWDKLLKKKMKAPFVPKLEDAENFEFFDPEFTSERTFITSP